MGLLTVDVTMHGVVMSADSQLVEIAAGVNHPSPGSRRRNPIVVREGGGFTGLVGFAGTEQVEGKTTRDWLDGFSKASPNDDVGTFCRRLAAALTHVWQRDGMSSILEVLVTGEVNGDLQFWYVRNSAGLRPSDWVHNAPAPTFTTENDLDHNYIAPDIRRGETKDDVLLRRSYSFRQGVLVPAAFIFDGFTQLLDAMRVGGVPGFRPLATLDDVGQFALMRMEVLKRLCDPAKGIYASGVPRTVAGVAHVYGVGRKGEVRAYPKGLQHIKTIRAGRP
jgi:hypothetical protein